MPIQIDKCVKAIKKGIKKGEIPKYYLKDKKRMKTNPWAICKSAFGIVKTKK